MFLLKIPKIVFQSPLIEYANFEDGKSINLIKLLKPYSNGYLYAIHNHDKEGIELFRNYKKAKTKFELMFIDKTHYSKWFVKGNNYEK